MSKQVQLIQITPEELTDMISDALKKELDEIKRSFEPKKPVEYITRTEASEMLKIDISTVHNWTKRGLLKSYGIGSRVYYKRSEVENSIIKLN